MVPAGEDPGDAEGAARHAAESYPLGCDPASWVLQTSLALFEKDPELGECEEGGGGPGSFPGEGRFRQTGTIPGERREG